MTFAAALFLCIASLLAISTCAWAALIILSYNDLP